MVDQIVDPFRAQLDLALMGHPVQLVAFRPARGPVQVPRFSLGLAVPVSSLKLDIGAKFSVPHPQN